VVIFCALTRELLVFCLDIFFAFVLNRKKHVTENEVLDCPQPLGR
jgi:hypothetical protein